MRIAVYHNLPSGGARRALYNMVVGLAARGYVIDEFCPQTANVSFLSLDPYVRQSVVIPYVPRGVCSRRLPFLTPYVNALSLTTDLLQLDRVNREIARIINDGDYDVCFTHDCLLAQNPDIPRYLRVPSVHYCHHGAGSRLPGAVEEQSIGGWATNVKRTYYALARWFYPWLREKRAALNIGAATVVLTNSYFAREGLYRAYGVDSEVCYLGVDSERFRPLEINRERFVLGVGAIHYNKGYRFLVRSLGCLPSSQRPSLVIAANGADTQERTVLEEMAREFGVVLDIRSVVDDAELVQLYNRAGAFVYTPIMEPFGLALLEAMACGTPAISVREGGPREVIQGDRTGFLVDRNEQDFSSAVAALLSDDPLCSRLGSAAVADMQERWTWERTVDRVEMAFSKAMAWA